MSTSLSWPSALPKPLMETHGFKPRPPTIRTEVERGKAQQRRRTAQVPTDVPFSLVLDAEQMAIFEAWTEYRAQHGARWFAIDLWSGVGLSSHEARIRELEEFKQLKIDRWRVTGTFEVRERPMLTAEMLELLFEWGGDPHEFVAAIQTLTLQIQTIQMMGNHR